MSNKPHSLPRWLRFFVYATLTVVVLGLLGTYALPSLLRPWLETQASTALKRQVAIGGLEMNFYSFRLSLNDVSVKDQYGIFVEFKQLTVDAEIASIFKMAPVLREVTLDQARVNLLRLTQDEYNFSDLIKPKDDKDTPLPSFSINNIRLKNSQIRLDDRVVGKSQMLDQLNIALPFVSNFATRIDEYIQPVFEGRLNGRQFALQVKSKPFKDSLETALTLNMEGQNLTEILAYVPLPEGLTVPSAVLSANVDLIFQQQAKRADILINGKLALTDFALNQQNAPILGLKQMTVELKNMKPLLDEYKLGLISVKGLDVAVVRDAAGGINWQKLQGELATKPATSTVSTAKPESAAPNASDPLIEVAEFQMSESQISFHDQAVRPAVKTALQAMNLNLKNISNKPDSRFPLLFQAQIETGGAAKEIAEGVTAPTLNFDLTIAPKPFSLAGHVSASGIEVEKFAPYYRAFLPANLVAKAGVAGDVKFDAESMRYSLDKATLAIEKLALTLPKQKKPSLQIKQFDLTDVALDSSDRLLKLGKLESTGGDLQLQLLKDGELNLMQALAPSTGKPETKKAKKQRAPAWRVQLGKGHLAGWQVQVRDESVEKSKPFIFKGIDLQLKNVDTKAGVTAQLALKAAGARGAKINLTGPWVPQPFSGKFKIDLNQLDAVAGQPYFSKYLNISLASGFLHAKGELQLATQPGFSGSYKGSIRSTNFYALDKNTGADFLKWSSLSFGGINTQFKPLKVEIGEIAMTDFFSRLILSADGRLNLQDVMVQNGESVSVTTARPAPEKSLSSVKPANSASSANPTTPTTPTNPTIPVTPVSSAEGGGEGNPTPISIGKITLTGGNITYSDLFIKPNFTANLTDMAGVIGGVSSMNDTRATVDLRGSVDRIAPVEIKGSVNPLAKVIFIDLKGGVKGYELTNASAYAIKYAGYGIQKGKLSMDVSYLIENNQLKASNQLFLDQLTLGEAVESPTATKLPVRFALSLLKDRNGQIKLNLPIEGSLDDPQFSIGGIIFQVIGNILQKVVTSPFSALASLFGDGPTLSRIEYPAGRVVLDDQAKVAIKNLAQALADRPSITLEIAGWASLNGDAEGLRQQMLNSKMLAVKAAGLGEKAESVNSEAEVALTEKEIPELMAQVYKKESFPKPKNVVGLSKTLPVSEMQKLILANMLINDESLKALAMQRAQSVKNALKDAGVDDARMFITQAKINPTNADTQDDKGSLSRVQFTLK